MRLQIFTISSSAGWRDASKKTIILLIGIIGSLTAANPSIAEIYFEDFTDGVLGSSNIDWGFTTDHGQQHSMSADGLLLSTEVTCCAGSTFVDLPADRTDWSIRANGRVLQDHAFIGVGTAAPEVSHTETWATWSVLTATGVALVGGANVAKEPDLARTDLMPFEEDVTFQLDSFDGMLRMWAWRDGEQPDAGSEPLTQDVIDLPHARPYLWVRSDTGPSSALFNWAAYSTEHIPLDLDVAAIQEPITQEFKIVVPNGLEFTEGDSSSGSFKDPFRNQVLIPSSEFSDLPLGKYHVTGLAFRPDADSAAGRMLELLDLEYRLSTTSNEVLSKTYADNVGPDETVVFTGDATATVTSNQGDVRDFELTAEFQKPFVYDPSKGHLLLETLAPEGSPIPWTVDQVSQSVLQRIVTFGIGEDVDGPTAVTPAHNTNIPVMQFTFELLELAGDINSDGEVNFADFLVLSNNFGSEVELPGMSGDIDGNGVVEFPDFLILSTNFGESTSTANSVPEPAGLSLAAVAIGLLGLIRSRR